MLELRDKVGPAGTTTNRCGRCRAGQRLRHRTARVADPAGHRALVGLGFTAKQADDAVQPTVAPPTEAPS